jgi:hypothetical protein
VRELTSGSEAAGASSATQWGIVRDQFLSVIGLLGFPTTSSQKKVSANSPLHFSQTLLSLELFQLSARFPSTSVVYLRACGEFVERETVKGAS